MRNPSRGQWMGTVVLGSMLMGCAAGGRADVQLPEAPESNRAAQRSRPTLLATPSPTPASIVLATAPSVDPGPTTVSPPHPRPTPEWLAAPELEADAWLNSEPLSLADLRGKVVIIEFWTYG